MQFREDSNQCVSLHVSFLYNLLSLALATVGGSSSGFVETDVWFSHTLDSRNLRGFSDDDLNSCSFPPFGLPAFLQIRLGCLSQSVAVLDGKAPPCGCFKPWLKSDGPERDCWQASPRRISIVWWLHSETLCESVSQRQQSSRDALTLVLIIALILWFNHRERINSESR